VGVVNKLLIFEDSHLLKQVVIAAGNYFDQGTKFSGVKISGLKSGWCFRKAATLICRESKSI
jgi:hypothetical protein